MVKLACVLLGACPPLPEAAEHSVQETLPDVAAECTELRSKHGLPGSRSSWKQ